MKYNTIVIGSGPGGYTAAIRLAQLGAKVAIIERDLVGGICTNWGCTPSKAMITSAKYAKYAKQSAHYGINVGEPVVDFQKVAERRDAVFIIFINSALYPSSSIPLAFLANSIACS